MHFFSTKVNLNYTLPQNTHIHTKKKQKKNQEDKQF